MKTAQTHLRFLLVLPLLIGIQLLTGCSGLIPTEAPSSPAVASELEICNTSTSYSPGVVVSGTAVFKKRGLNITQNSGVVTNVTLGAVNTTTLPIKYAEVRVLDSAGSVIQCGATNSVGQLVALDGINPLRIANSAGTYTVQVLSRSHQAFTSTSKSVSPTLNVSIKEDIYSNDVYKLSSTLVSSGFGGATNASLSLVAQADENVSSKIEGGAFNIYNNWISVFEYVASGTVTSTDDVSCLNNRLDIYWKAGFNPYLYIDPGADPSNTLSFYVRGDNELYVNGGVSGNVTSVDTDHFDDTVILHEIGHHIEANCGSMDSPGGKHYAQYRIDPRLAWSEGWGNFFGGHILKNTINKINPDVVSNLPNNEWLHYNDTKGYTASGNTNGSSLILMRLNEAGTSANFDAVNYSSYPGESHTREASIARGLFKGTNSCAANCTSSSVSFEKYWRALGTTSQGMGASTQSFRSSAKFIDKLKTINSGSLPAGFQTMVTTDEALHPIGSSALNVVSGTTTYSAWPGYAIKLQTGASCEDNVLQPRNTSKTAFNDSDQRYTNHFYHLNSTLLSSVSSIKIVLLSDNTACPLDVDLVLFKESYTYNQDCTAYYSNNTCASYNKTTSSSVANYNRSSYSIENYNSGSINSTGAVSATLRTKTISLNGLASGNYLLNIRYYSSSPTTTSSSTFCAYRLLTQSGGLLCPNSSY